MFIYFWIKYIFISLTIFFFQYKNLGDFILRFILSFQEEQKRKKKTKTNRMHKEHE